MYAAYQLPFITYFWHCPKVGKKLGTQIILLKTSGSKITAQLMFLLLALTQGKNRTCFLRACAHFETLFSTKIINVPSSPAYRWYLIAVPEEF